jgi:hypothetical protein
MNVIHLVKKDPEERHLSRFPKGREGVENGNFDRGLGYRSSCRGIFGRSEG